MCLATIQSCWNSIWDCLYELVFPGECYVEEDCNPDNHFIVPIQDEKEEEEKEAIIRKNGDFVLL